MKTIEGSPRGRGGSGYRGGRGISRGRGGGSSGGRGRGGSGGDKRFNSRFTDPRFQLSKRVKQAPSNRGQAPRNQLEQAAEHDPRFRKFLKKPSHQDEEQHESEEEQEEEESVTASDACSQGDDEEMESIPEELAQELDEEVNAWAPEALEMIEARRRVAIVNCDWDHIRAVDLYAILFHALPLGGQLEDVCIYQSEFGKKMIEHERTHGPDLWSSKEEVIREAKEEAMRKAAEPIIEELPDDEPLTDDGSDQDGPVSDGWEDDNPNMVAEEGENGEMFSNGKYRKYEMDRMQYYYAVATFDSADTAAAVYEQLDGMDIEASGVVLDLRYVDDEETFDTPVGRADRIPPNFRPLSSFKAAALTQTKFRISWDQDDVFRHQSVQDAFTGDTAEDDLAAYMAPPDSDDDEVDARTGRTKGEEKLRVRRKYAALLEEIGGLAEDEAALEDDDAEGPTASASSPDSSGSDDDSLNRFSDVEFDGGDEESQDDEDNEDDRASDLSSLEATLDIDADSKAADLQRETRLRQRMKTGDLADKAELKYRLRRKDMKKAKKEMLKQQREDEKQMAQNNREAEKAKLRALMGEEDVDGSAATGKARRKAHARQVKERLALEREETKKRRAANQFGVTQELRRMEQQKEAKQAVETLDSRFQSKLLSDPRFQLDVSQKDKRMASDVVDLAGQVAKARLGQKASAASRPQQTVSGSSPNAGKKRSAAAADESAESSGVQSAVDFFLSKPATKKARRH